MENLDGLSQLVSVSWQEAIVILDSNLVLKSSEQPVTFRELHQADLMVESMDSFQSF